MPHSPTIVDWTIPGAEGEPILGNTHWPIGSPRGIAIIAHGFKGYKDYGMFPAIAHHFAQAGFIAHRFNFSHSGMTNDTATFARPDLFERDTWNKQVFDLNEVVKHAVRMSSSIRMPSSNGGNGTSLPSPSGRGAGGEGSSLPFLILGHSRGGMTMLLWAGRTIDDANVPKPAGLIALAAPSRPFLFTDADKKLMREQGYIESPSSRTGQKLRVGKQYIEEQLADPEGHDVILQTKRIRCPICIIHGENDHSVPVQNAHELAAAAGKRAELHIIPGTDHVFNTPNPFAMDDEPSEALRSVLASSIQFADRACAAE